MTEHKICPFLEASEVAEPRCRREGCQLWVDAVKVRELVVGTTSVIRMADPDYEYAYSGCGLVQVIPWQLVKKEKKNEPDK